MQHRAACQRLLGEADDSAAALSCNQKARPYRASENQEGEWGRENQEEEWGREGVRVKHGPEQLGMQLMRAVVAANYLHQQALKASEHVA